MEKVGRPYLKERRESLGIKQKHIAAKLGYTTSNQYSMMERDRSVAIKVGQAITIAEILHTSVEELFSAEKVQVNCM